MNHKNFVFTLVLILLVALKLQSTTFELTLFKLSLLSRYRLYLISNFTSLSFLKLVNELYFEFLFADCSVRLRILTRSLPQGNSLNRSLSSLHSTKIIFKELPEVAALCGRICQKDLSLYKAQCLATHREARVIHSSKKEVFQPHLPVRLPCYDLAPVTSFALGRSLRSRTSDTPGSHGLTGGVYKARERIHRAMADARLLANPTSWRRVSASNPN